MTTARIHDEATRKAFHILRLERGRDVTRRLALAVAGLPLVTLGLHQLLEPGQSFEQPQKFLLSLALLLLHPVALSRRWPAWILPWVMFGGLLGVEGILMWGFARNPELLGSNLPAFQFFLLFPPILGQSYGVRANQIGVVLLWLLPLAMAPWVQGFSRGHYLAFATTSLMLALYLNVLLERFQVRQFLDRRAIEDLAQRDPLSGLLNRRSFTPMAEGVLRTAARSGAPVSVLAVDADHFKAINDRHGHGTGDEVIQAIARTMGDTLRSSDLLVRMGGEEFAALMPDTDLEAGRVAAERLRTALEGLHLPVPQGGSLAFTASLGLAQWVGAPEGLDALLARADQALYQAKALGRNRVEADAGQPGQG